MRRLTLLLVVIAALLGLGVMLMTGGDEPPPSGFGEESTGPATNEGIAAGQVPSGTGPEGEADRAEDRQTAAERARLAPVTAVAQGESLVRVRVVRKGTDVPVANAEVSYVESYDTQRFTEAERAEYARLFGDNEKLTRRYGTTVETDGEGIAVLSLEKYGRVTARSGELYGDIFLRRQPADQEKVYPLEVELDVTLEVRVVDASGRPAAGVPVMIQPRGRDGGGVGNVQQLGTTQSPAGSFTIDHLQTSLQEFDSYLLRPDVPGQTGAWVRFDRDDPPAYPIVLHLPVTGSVVVRTTGVDGEALPDGFLSGVTLAVAPNEPLNGKRYRAPADQQWRSAVGETGTVRFDWVVAGKSYVASASPAQQYVQEVFHGPASAGAEVHVTLGLETRPYFLLGRALNEGMEPFRDTVLSLDYGRNAEPVSLGEVHDRESVHEVQTDDEGRFRVHVPTARGNAGKLIQRLSIREPDKIGDPSPRRIYALRDGLTLVPGDNDLGDVVLKPGALVAAGQIFVDGQVTARRAFLLRVLPAGGVPMQARSGLVFTSVAADPDVEMYILEGGRFEVRGEPRHARYVVESRSSRYLPVTPVAFSPGDMDLRIELQSGGSLLAEILGDESVPLSSVGVELHPVDSQNRSAGGILQFGGGIAPPVLGGSVARGEVSDGRRVHRWNGLRPGIYRFQVLLPGALQPLLTVPDVRVEQGDNRDPRLEGIDLRGRLRQFKVSVLGAGRRPIPDGAGTPIVVIDRPGADRLAGFEARGGQATVIAADRFLDLLVAARGYAPKQVFRVHEDTEVVLEPFPEVVVRVLGDREDWPRNHTMLVSLGNPARRDMGRRSVDYEGGSSQLAYWLEPLSSLQELDARNEVRLAVYGGGRYLVRVSLRNDATRGTGAVVGVEPSEVTLTGGGGQVIEVRLPSEALEKAAEQAGR